MQYPHNFFYKETQSAINYGRQATGTLAVKRLIDGKPCWIEHSLPTTLKKKSLILADWTAPTWPFEKINDVKKRLIELMDDGWNIYIYVNGKNFLINKQYLNWLDDLENRKGINIQSTQEIAKSAATEYKLAIGSVEVLDDYWVNQLLSNQQELQPRVLKISELPELTQEALDILSKVSPPVTKIIVDVFSQKANDKKELLEKTLVGIEIEYNYMKADLSKLREDNIKKALRTIAQLDKLEIINLSSSSISIPNLQIILNAAPNLKEMDLSYCKEIIDESLEISPTSLVKLERINLSSSSISIANLQIILNAAPNLKEMDLSYCKKIIDNSLAIRPTSLLKLERINLSSSYISIANLQIILNAAPNLKEINFNYCKESSIETLILDINSLKNLEKLYLDTSNITFANLQAILKAAPNLKEINLSTYFNIQGNFLELDANSLIKLEKINLNSSKISLANLQTILNAAPNLKEIDLNSCNDIDIDHLMLEPNSLKNLEKINLNSSNISLANLQTILNAAPNLKEVNLGNCENIGFGDLVLEINSLKNLEIINLKDSNISSQNLEIILNKAASLKKLCLGSCDALLNLQDNALKKLENIDVSSTTISIQNLTNILTAATNLKKVNFSYCNTIDVEPIELKDDNLKQLEEIDLSYAHISSQNLKAILAAATNLKKIELRGCETIDNYPIELTAESLKKLEEIDLSESLVSIKTVETILTTAGNLEIINLKYCNFAHEEIHLQSDSLLKLKNIQLDNNSISIQILEEFLKAAPNLDETCKLKILEMIKIKQERRIPRSHTELLQPINPRHNASEFKDFKPNDKPFEFTGKNNTKNQGMIIEKLCQYLKNTHQHLEIIPKIQNGICVALSHYFSACYNESWDQFIDRARAWDGQNDTCDEVLSDHFEVLYRYIEYYQLHQTQTKQYLGDALTDFLSANTNPCILHNPWHAITIKPTEDYSWLVYDPNYTSGYKTVSKRELAKTIHDAIGSIVSIESDIPYASIISDPNDFLANGGLIALCKSANADKMLVQLQSHNEWSDEALNGIFLRSTTGAPAWAIGLASQNPAIIELTQTLKNEFEARNPKDSVQKFAKSLEALTPMQQHECITNIIQSSPKISFDEPLLTAIRTLPNKDHYEKTLKTWEKNKVVDPPPFQYCQHCLSSEDKKQLIELDSTQQVDSLRTQLEQYATIIKRRVFYIDKPDDLICSAAWIEKNARNQGTLHTGPGGALHEFLEETGDEPALLIVNYENFNADDIIRFNKLLDKTPYADTTPLSSKTMVIGLLNRNKPDVYQGSDFYSRFNSITHLQEFNSTITSRTVDISITDTDTAIINLYHAPDWEERLLGRWILNGDTLTFQEGELIKAIKSGKSITIKNGLWQDQAFARFWQQALSCGIRNLEIPEGINILRPEIDAYTWDNIPECSQGLSPDVDAHVLNPTILSDFLEHYTLAGENLVRTIGFIEAHKNQTCTVNVTRTLSHDEWAILLDECKIHNVTLKVYAAPEVILPEAFGSPTTFASFSADTTNPNIIISTDIDTSVALLTIENPDILVIDVSECSPADLLTALDGGMETDPPRFKFRQSIGAVTTALSEHKNIILKGHFSPELMDSLAPILLRDQQNKLTLITDDTSAGPFIANRVFHQVTAAEKKACLKTDKRITPLLQEYFATEPLSKLKARSAFLKANPKSKNSDDAWLGMNLIPVETYAKTSDFDKSRSAIDTSMHTKARIAKVNAALDSAPFVFLTGLSGVGKTTFVEQELCKNDNLYLTEDSLQAWALDTSDKRKILFIDEANLSQRQWSEFEGLFNTPPTILINGTIYPLTTEHKVVFAGNPVNYGDERTLAPFFKHHGQAVLFTPLPNYVIYEKILKPVFNDIGMDLNLVTDKILDVYNFIQNCSTTGVLISPRELQMMALLIITQKELHPDIDIAEIASHVTYQIAKNLIPKEKTDEFDELFKPINQLIFVEQTFGSDYIATNSRLPVLQQMNELLALHAWRQENATTINTAQKSGGLGGIIIEGEPGIGKSELVFSTLVAHGYEIETDFKNPSTKPKPFYNIPVSMPLSEKEDLLIKAFNEGAVVVVDEINSSPMMERLLNSLLMGQNPRAKEGDVVKPGFMLIGTQNPITMAGRRAASTALQRRLINVELPEYSQDEMKFILLNKGVDEIEAESMLSAYMKNREYALENKLSPPPTFRDLIELADNHLKAKATMQSLELIEEIEAIKEIEPIADKHIEYIDLKQITPNIEDPIKKDIIEDVAFDKIKENAPHNKNYQRPRVSSSGFFAKKTGEKAAPLQKDSEENLDPQKPKNPNK